MRAGAAGVKFNWCRVLKEPSSGLPATFSHRVATGEGPQLQGRGPTIRDLPERRSLGPVWVDGALEIRAHLGFVVFPEFPQYTDGIFVVPVDAKVHQREMLLVVYDEGGGVHRPFLAAAREARFQCTQQAFGEVLIGVGGEGVGHDAREAGCLEEISCGDTINRFGNTVGAEDMRAGP